MLGMVEGAGREGKTYKRASNACVNFLKSVPNFTLFCCKSELCCNFAFGVILMIFNFVIFLPFTLKRETNLNNYIFIASIDVWQSF